MNRDLRISMVQALVALAALHTAQALADPSQNCAQSEDPDLAIDACSILIESSSHDQLASLTNSRAVAYLKKGDCYHAASDFTSSLMFEESAEKYYQRGAAYLCLSSDDPSLAASALSDFDQTIRLRPDLDGKLNDQLASAHATLALAEISNHQDDKAKADQAAAVQLAPAKARVLNSAFADGYWQRGQTSQASGSFSIAAGDYQQAIDLDPATSNKISPYLQEAKGGTAGPYSLYLRGNQHLDDHELDAAVQDYSDAIQAQPNLVDAYLGRAQAYRQLNRPDEAQGDFDQAIKLDETNWWVFYLRGDFNKSVAQFDRASADFAKALTIVEQAHDVGYEGEKQQIDDAIKSLKFDSTLESHWISYLKQIQADHNDKNWESAPYDLYVARHNLPNSPSLESASSENAPPSSADSSDPTGQPSAVDWDPWMPWLWGLLIVLGIGVAPIILVSRHVRTRSGSAVGPVVSATEPTRASEARAQLTPADHSKSGPRGSVKPNSPGVVENIAKPGRMRRLDEPSQESLPRVMAGGVTVLLGRYADDLHAATMSDGDDNVVIAKSPASLSKLPEKMFGCRIICPYPTRDIRIGIDVSLGDQQSCSVWRQCFDANLIKECEGKVAVLPTLDVMGVLPAQSFYIVAGWKEGATRENVAQFANALVEVCWRDR